ncbi:hypothetical protein CDL15_Pgr005926 [Punica granatum]|uniref:Polygalacturonase-like n=1 Tax=Punica granatum TaxID=22663 RepID=A0A218WGW1_PUNGR|nr:hypothetical protein CDL15_Pgr005926 [Punica granatum]
MWSDETGYRLLRDNKRGEPIEIPNTATQGNVIALPFVVCSAVHVHSDDCVSIGDYTSNIHISSSICGPGHGVSIGSLGRSGNVVQVEDIHVSKVNFEHTTKGARIKTWQVGTGYVRRVTFEDIKLDSVQNPIIINQSCCQTRGACEEKHSGVHISNVTYNDLSGTSSTNVAINFNRSRSIACTGIVLKSINLTSAKPRGRVTSSCTNAYGNVIGGVQPKPCLLVAKITA